MKAQTVDFAGGARFGGSPGSATAGGGAGSTGDVTGGAGSANTGGGGGGTGSLVGSGTGGAGGSGVVIFTLPKYTSVSFSAGVTFTATTVGNDIAYTVTATSTTSETVTIS